MSVSACTVLFPCHSLEDFPSWSSGVEAEDLLAAWSSAWHPRLLATLGRIPSWASIDSPPDPAPETLFIVPAAHDDRLHGNGFPATGISGLYRSERLSIVRRLRSRTDIVDASIESLETESPEATRIGRQPIPLTEDFYALGMAWLWSELLARRMRTTVGLDLTEIAAGSVEAARLAVEGREEAARKSLAECFASLEAVRKRYYPVDIWLVDLILLAETTGASALTEEVSASLPSGFVASGKVLDALAVRSSETLKEIGRQINAGLASGCGGMWDDTPLGLMTAEELRGSFDRGLEVWQRHVGAAPTVFARRSGARSALLPQLLSSLGFAGALWQSFDGSRMPPTGGSRVRWDALQGKTVEVLARSATDARSAASGVSLHDTLGDILDHDHAAVLPFAHYPGTTAEWFRDFRRIATWADVFGRFLPPHEIFPRTAATATRLDLGADRYPDELPKLVGGDLESPLESAILSTEQAASSLRSAATRRLEVLREALPGAGASHSISSSSADTISASFLAASSEQIACRTPDDQLKRAPRQRRWWSAKRKEWRPGEVLPLDNGSIRIEIHPRSGGIVAIRNGRNRPNRLSQRLSVRSTRPVFGKWEDPLDRSDYAVMTADSIEPISAADGQFFTRRDDGTKLAAVSKGRLCTADGHVLGRFVQSVTLAENLPLVQVDIEIELEDMIRPVDSHGDATGWFDRYAACRFAWNENDSLDLFRGLHTQAVETERTVFSSPYFMELRAGDGRASDRSRWTPEDKGGVTILPLGLPWHVRSSPHMLDTILIAPGGKACRRRLAIGLGIERPWETAASLICGEIPLEDHTSSGQPLAVDPPGRLTGCDPIVEGGRTVGLRLGVLATGAAAARVTLSSALPVETAYAIDAVGRRLRPLAVESTGVMIPLERHEWLMAELRWKAADQGDLEKPSQAPPETAG